MKEEIEFDFNEILDKFRSGEKLTGKGGLDLVKSNLLTRSTAPAVEPLSEYKAQKQAHITKKLLH